MHLKSILAHPDTLEPLQIDWDNKIILSDFDGKYRAGFEGKVPFVLPVKHIQSKSSSIHRTSNTAFDYLDHYQNDAEAFDYFQPMPGKVDREERNRLDQVIIQAIPSNSKLVLDVGCGNGWLAKAIVDDHTTVISMDVSSRNPVEALKRHPHPRHEALIADVYHLPIMDNSLDCIVASEIMEHVPDPGLFIQKLLRVLKPGGKLIITTPYNEQIQYHLCVHCNRLTPAHAHLHSFNEENITRLIPENIRHWDWRAFSHRYMNKARVYTLMEKFPFSAWKSVDQLANKVWRKPMRLLVELKK